VASQRASQARWRLPKNGAGVQYYANHPIRFGIGAASSTWLNRASSSVPRPSDGRANQIRVADTAEYVERERLPRDASREFRASLDVSVSADAGVGLAKRTENKRNKADHGPIEYCGRSDWSALIHRKDSAMTTATPTTPLSVNTWAISAAVKHTSSAPRGRGAAEFHVGNQCSRETHIVSTTWAWCR